MRHIRTPQEYRSSSQRRPTELNQTLAIRRLKNKWHRPQGVRWSRKSVENHASALAFISWSASLETARKLHGDGYEYESDYQRIGVISELLAFSLHLCDRLAFDRLDETHCKENETEILLNNINFLENVCILIEEELRSCYQSSKEDRFA